MQMYIVVPQMKRGNSQLLGLAENNSLHSQLQHLYKATSSEQSYRFTIQYYM